jgi:hypothetical protein
MFSAELDLFGNRQCFPKPDRLIVNLEGIVSNSSAECERSRRDPKRRRRNATAGALQMRASDSAVRFMDWILL